MLQCCVCLSFVVVVVVCNDMYCGYKRCVLEQKLLLKACRKSYLRNRLVPKCMTLTFVQRSFRSRKQLRRIAIEYLGNR